jgi:hypothetical protein
VIKVLVKDPAVTERSGTKAGRNWHMRTQQAWAQLPSKPYPTEITITLNDSQAAFPVGDYVLDASSAWVTKYGDLRLDLAKMRPVQPAAAGPRSAAL